VAGAGLSSVGRAAFLHNVIIGLADIFYGGTYFIKPYNATLCKEALGKVFVAEHSHLTEKCFCGHTKTFKYWPVVWNGGLKF
jgi:hypothetical protein